MYSSAAQRGVGLCNGFFSGACRAPSRVEAGEVMPPVSPSSLIPKSSYASLPWVHCVLQFVLSALAICVFAE